MAAAETQPTENTPLLREETRTNGTSDPEQATDESSTLQENGAKKDASSTSTQLRYIVPAISIGVSSMSTSTDAAGCFD